MPNSMVFAPPYTELQTEFYKLMTNADEMDFEVYDSGMSIQEIMGSLKLMNTINYGIIADITGTQTAAKTDTIIWQMNIRLELFSNYKGRKQIADMINTVAKVVTTYQNEFNANLCQKGYFVVRNQIGESAIGSAIGDGNLTWQNGYITITYFLSQLED